MRKRGYMSDKAKLIIEIPKEDIEFIRKTSFVEDEKTMFKQSPSDRQGTMTLFRLMDSIKNGIPLDDVKAEIDKAQEPYKTSTAYDEGVRFGLMLAYQIIDKYKAESEGE